MNGDAPPLDLQTSKFGGCLPDVLPSNRLRDIAGT